MAALSARLGYPLIILVLFLLAWEGGAREGLFPPYVLPAPSVIAARFVDTTDQLVWHALTTGKEIILGFVLAVVVGVLLAALIVFVRPIEQAIYPWLVVVQVIPKVALGPLLIVWLGFGLLPKVLISFLLAFFPIMIDAMVGLKSVQRDSFFLLRSMGAGPVKTFCYLQLPNALPNIFGSLKVGITLATVGAIVGEFIGADTGLGYVLIFANGNLDTSLLFVALAWITALALILYGIIAGLEKVFVHWHVSVRGAGAGAMH
jgi:NitT/TauT family transport system permease protein